MKNYFNEKKPVSSSFKAGRRSIGRLIMRLKQLERHPHTFGAAGCLTPSEIHTIDAIGCGRGLLMGELAVRLGVTKGAVSQVVKRLEQKGCVCRKAHPEDSRAIIVSLTEAGCIACRIHEQQNEAFYAKLSAQLGVEEIAVFNRCIDKLCDMLQH